jgi:hypothetical protein
MEAAPEPSGDLAREELLLLAAPKVTTAKPKVTEKEKPRTAKEALLLRSRQPPRPKPGKAGKQERRPARREPSVPDAIEPGEAPSSTPSSTKKAGPEGRRRPSPPPVELEAVPPPPPPGLWSRIKGFFGG